jgi:hypothetical protein
VDGAGAGGVAVLPPAPAGLDELAGLDGADDELDDDAQPVAIATQISAATARPEPRFPLPERSRVGNTPAPPI